MTSLPRVLLVAILLAPVAAYSQSGGGGGAGGGGSAGGGASAVLPVGQLVVRLPEAQAQWAHRVQDPLEQVRRL